MRLIKSPVLFILAIITAMPLLSQEGAGLFFLSKKGDVPGAVALSGAKDAAEDFRKDTKKDIKITPHSYSDVNELGTLLERAYISGAKGAIITIDGDLPLADEDILNARLKDLQKRKFTIAVIGGKNNEIDTPIKGINDEEELLSKLGKMIGQYSERMGFQALSFAPENNTYEFSEEISKKIADKFSGGKIRRASLFSIYQAQHDRELERQDNYALIFLSPELLADAHAFKADKDRLFSVVLGARAAVIQLFQLGYIDACITPDYYGFGYAAARRVIERAILERDSLGVFRLPPKVYDKSNTKKFLSDWSLYLN